MKHIDLEQFAGGKLSVQLNKALEKITENVQDPNTDAQVVTLHMEKHYAEDPRVEVEIEEIK